MFQMVQAKALSNMNTNIGTVEAPNCYILIIKMRIQGVSPRDQRVGVFNFGTDRVRVLEKTSGSGSGTDRVRVLALHFYQSGIIGY